MAADLIDKIRDRQSGIEAHGVRDDGYEVPYTTLHVGVVHGGTVLNIVPSKCDLEFEIRNAEQKVGVARAARWKQKDGPVLQVATDGLHLEPVESACRLCRSGQPVADSRVDAIG